MRCRRVLLRFPPPFHVDRHAYLFAACQYLTMVRSALRDDGMLIVNVAARSPALFFETLGNVQFIFPMVYELRATSEDINRTLFALRTAQSTSATAAQRRSVAIERWLSQSSLFRGLDPLGLDELVGQLNLTSKPTAGGSGTGMKKRRGS